MRIRVGMISTPKIGQYAHFAEMINLAYCTQHGYEFVVERCPNDLQKSYKWDDNDQKRAVWFKCEFALSHLNDCDYFCFIDSDAYFDDFSQSLSNLIQISSSDVVLLIQPDCWDNLICKRNHRINTGFFIFKNHPKSFDLLNAWLKAAEADDNTGCNDLQFKHPREQGCLQRIIDQSISDADKSNLIKILDKKLVGNSNSTFVKHLMLTSNKTRHEEIFTKLKHILNDL